jgi:hypothetical protein
LAAQIIGSANNLQEMALNQNWFSIFSISCIVNGLLIMLDKVEPIKPHTEHQGILAIPSGALGQIATENNRIITGLNDGEFHKGMTNMANKQMVNFGCPKGQSWATGNDLGHSADQPIFN